MEELAQGEQTALSNSGAIFCGVYMQDETHLFVAGNNGMEGALYSYTYDADASANLNQELNIYALQDSDTLRQAVNIFRQEYADIYVNLEIGMTDDNGRKWTGCAYLRWNAGGQLCGKRNFNRYQ